MVYYLARMTDDDMFVLTGRDGYPLEFNDRVTASILCRALQEAGMHCMLIDLEPEYEVLDLPLDTLGLSSERVVLAAQRLREAGVRYDPPKTYGTEVRS